VKRRVIGLLACVVLGGSLGVAAYASLIGIPFGPQAKGDLELARSDQPGQRVLFIGNSLTYYNAMPSMVRELAARDQGAPTLFVAQYTAPGWSLRRASAHDGLQALLEEIRWNEVVLQERSDERHPFARDLHSRVAAGGGETIIFDLGAGGAGPYADVAHALSATLAPVWAAWEEAHSRDSALDLLADDEHHPNRAGSFLIACVFYAVLTDRDPAGSDYTGDIEPAQARFLKRVAWDAYQATLD
jgi:hypothetical protein